MELWRANINFRGMRPGREVIIDPKDWEPEIEAGFLTKVLSAQDDQISGLRSLGPDDEISPLCIDEKPAKNESRMAWASYAQTLGIRTNDLNRNQLIEAVENYESA